MKYRVEKDGDDYLIGYDGENGFTPIAQTRSSYRARQIADLLTKTETCQCCHGATCELHG